MRAKSYDAYFTHGLGLVYKVDQEDPGMGKGDRMPDNGKGRMNFLGVLHVA